MSLRFASLSARVMLLLLLLLRLGFQFLGGLALIGGLLQHQQLRNGCVWSECFKLTLHGTLL